MHMEESDEHASGVVVKNRNSSGCLVLRKKGDVAAAAASSTPRKVYMSKKGRARLVMSDSGSSDDLLLRNILPPTVNGLTVFDNGSQFGRKRNRLEHTRPNGIGVNGQDARDFKKNKLDVFEFDEYDRMDDGKMRMGHYNEDSEDEDESDDDVGGRRFLGSMNIGRSGSEREFESGSSRHVPNKSLYFGRPDRFEMERDEARLPTSYLRDKYATYSEEAIRLQGKNGVLKVMVNKNKKLADSLKNYSHQKLKDGRKGSMSEDIGKRNALVSPSFYSRAKVAEKPNSFGKTKKNKPSLRKSVPTKNSKASDLDSEDSDSSLKPGSKKNIEIQNARIAVSLDGEMSPSSDKLNASGTKEGKVKRGSGTEKQKLRERIRGMLLNAGWTIDYRPRRNRDYLDAVYINPTGTAYWSIIKAYDALQKQLNDEDMEAKPSGDDSFAPLSDEILSQLTRKTRKKIEKEMRKKLRDGNKSGRGKGVAGKKSSNYKHDEDSMDSDSQEEKLSSFIKHGGKSLKTKINDSGLISLDAKNQTSSNNLHNDVEKPSSALKSHALQGRKSRKLGRCTLLVRSASKGLNSETDGFVPFTGKRTLLSWLIDSGTVQLSQKVQYMNRRRAKVMLEGWVTRDGIHCGCCSKILTVAKFEIHAGSKLRQPFQNIYLDSGISLLQCQIDAWNRLEESERIGFHSVDIDGDDPNDDTCGICADGGDLICCDSCPSTFHQSCLDIEMLPPGDWHCPNCACKFCGIAGGSDVEEDDPTVGVLLTCSLCEKNYHKLCCREIDYLPVDSSSFSSFCGQKCREIFEHVHKYLGVKHELESGYSWSLIRRTDANLDPSLRGLPQRVECNSKLAVALTVMDECFLPIVDRRSGINLIHNVLYNSGSNFNRLNYSGFYTAILERGDEIISAASIRFHGARLAEMPFIGTRHIYRRQGMCRLLFYAIESALCGLKVEKLIIPAIAELMHTWTGVFGFTPLEEFLKQEMRSINMLVFPGTDMLQKNLLLKQQNLAGNSAGASLMENEGKCSIIPEVANKSDMEYGRENFRNEVSSVDCEAECLAVPTSDTLINNSLDASRELKIPVLSKAVMHSGAPSGDNLTESASARPGSHGCADADMYNNLSEINENGAGADCDSDQADNPYETSLIGRCLDVSHELKVPVPSEEATHPDSHSSDKLNDFDSTVDYLCECDDSSLHLVSDINDNCGLADNGSLRVDVCLNEKYAMSSPIHHEKIMPVSSEGALCSETHKLAKSDTSRKCSPSNASQITGEIDDKSVMGSPIAGKYEVDDGHGLNVSITCVESVLSGKLSGDNGSDNINEKANNVSVSSSHSTLNAMQIDSDAIDEIICKEDSKPDVASELISKAMHCNQPMETSCDGPETHVHERDSV